MGIEFSKSTPLTVTPNSTFGTVGGHERVTDSPQRAEKEEAAEEVEGLEEEEGEESEEGEEDEVFIPPLQPLIAAPI